MWSRPQRVKESIIKRELQKAHELDKLLKESPIPLTLKDLIDATEQ